MVWKVFGVDSYNSDTEEWCHHTQENENYEIHTDPAGVQWLTCKNCSRPFQFVHPVLVEELIRNRDKVIRNYQMRGKLE